MMHINLENHNCKNAKNDPIRFGSLLQAIDKHSANCVLWKVYKNTKDVMSTTPPQMFICNEPLSNLILGHTNLQMFGNSSEASILSYGCLRIMNSNVVGIIPNFSLN